MRLFEVTDVYIDDLITILRNLIGRGDSKDQPQQLTYSALSQLLRNMGYGDINQQILTRIYDDNTELQSLIADFDDEYMTLGTRVKSQEPGEQPMDIPLGGKSVDQMAKGGVSDHMKKISR